MSSLAVLAGFTSTVIFAAATLPMLRKAVVTRDLRSYSLGNIGLANVGNAVHSVYVLNLPPGPIWLLHGFYVLSSALMLVWYLRYAGRTRRVSQRALRRTLTPTRQLVVCRDGRGVRTDACPSASSRP